MRLLNRLLAALLSLALIVVGLLLIIETVADRVDHHRPAIVKWHGAYAWAGHTSWTQGSVRVGCIIAAAAGLLLLVAELKRPRVSRLRTHSDDEQSAPVDAAYTRRGVADAVRTSVVEVDGVRSAQVRVKRRTIRVRAATSARDDAAARTLKDPAVAAAQQRLEALRLAHMPRLTVTTIARKR